MEFPVWVPDWSYGCCGAPVGIGDSWTLVAVLLVDDVQPGDETLGIEPAGFAGIRFCVDCAFISSPGTAVLSAGPFRLASRGFPHPGRYVGHGTLLEERHGAGDGELDGPEGDEFDNAIEFGARVQRIRSVRPVIEQGDGVTYHHFGTEAVDLQHTEHRRRGDDLLINVEV